MTLAHFLIWLSWFLSQHCTLTWMSSNGQAIHFDGMCRQAWQIAQVNHGYLQIVSPSPMPIR